MRRLFTRHATFRTVSLLTFLLVLFLQALIIQNKPAQAAVGFRISGRNLLDVNGNNFIIRGISHAHVWYQSQTSSFANIKTVGKANAVRVVLSGGRWTPINTASDVTNVINLCKTNKLVCILENHDTTGYGEQGGAYTMAQAVDYWKSIQSALTGQENWVIINIGNEPIGNNNATQWIQSTRDAIVAMRAAGFQHVLMVDAPNWGQDWQFIMRDNAPTIKAADTTGNLIFSVHMYGVFDTAQEVNDYVASFVSRNLPLVIGEFGDNHSDGNPNEDAIMSAAQTNGIGYMGWSWSGNGGGVEYLDMVIGFNPAQISTWGNRIINGANGLAATARECTCFGGSVPTPTRTRTSSVPTNTRTPTRTGPTATRTPTRVGPTNTPTRTGPTATRTNTPVVPPTATSSGSTCSPVNATITAPFTQDGTGNFCWRSNNLGTYINSWNLTRLTINGVDFTNKYAFTNQLPAKASDGYWYISYSSPVAWGHFEARN